MDSSSPFDCPSAQPEMEGARPFGIISGTPTETRIAFFKKATLDSFSWQDQFATRDATRILRFGAKCDELRCGHFKESRCSLGERVNKGLPAVVDSLPSCLIRPKCRWYAEQGSEVCLRCPQVVTLIPSATNALNTVAAVG